MTLPHRWLPFLSVLVLIACGAPTAPEPTPDPDSQPVPDESPSPLATISGVINSTRFSRVDELHLAILWLPSYGQQVQQYDRRVVTQSVKYQGTLPLDYQFKLFEEPPPQAISEVTMGLKSGGSMKVNVAVGALIAFKDKNGNGQLDTVPVGSTPIDEVLGSSLSTEYWVFSQSHPEAYQIAYIGTDMPEGEGFTRGYNLQHQGQVGPLTSVPLRLYEVPKLSAIACDEFWNAGLGAGSWACGLWTGPEGIAISGGYRSEETYGSWSATADFTLKIRDRVLTPTDTEVRVNGVSLAFDSVARTFGLPEGVNPFTEGSTNTMTIEVTGQAAKSVSLPVMGAFGVTSPANGAIAAVGAPLEINWSASAGATHYDLIVNGAGLNEYRARSTLSPVDGTSFTTPATTQAGTVAIRMTAGWSHRSEDRTVDLWSETVPTSTSVTVQ